MPSRFYASAACSVILLAACDEQPERGHAVRIEGCLATIGNTVLDLREVSGFNPFPYSNDPRTDVLLKGSDSIVVRVELPDLMRIQAAWRQCIGAAKTKEIK